MNALVISQEVGPIAKKKLVEKFENEYFLHNTVDKEFDFFAFYE